MSIWEENVRKVIPYTPGEQPDFPDMIKLNTNENPYPPSPMVKAVMESMDDETFRLYPAPAADGLVEALEEQYGVPKDQIFVGVGSDDVLAMAFLTFFHSKKPILFPDITYSFYDVWADLFRIPYERIPLNESFEIVPEDYMRENGGIIFPNPNAPTGVEMSFADVERIIAYNPESVVIVDEAYVDFGGESVLPLIKKYENLLVVQTCSKSRSMAGMRIGYAFGSKKMIGYLNDAKYSFNSYTMNRPSILMGCAAIRDDEYFREITQKIVETREWTKKELKRLGFQFPDSKANFLFVCHESVAAKELFEALKQKHIFVRYFAKPRIDNYLRITIGTREQMEKLVEFLEDYLSVS